jgi:hypothetical protein
MKQLSMFEEEGRSLFLPKHQNKVESIVKFWVERHNIYLRRASGKHPKPWTADPALRNYRFCNIYRELDTVSDWIIRKVITKYEDNPNLWFMLGVSRLINWPDTLQHLMDDKVWPVSKFNPDNVYASLKDRKAKGEKIITGAYIVNSVFPLGANPKDKSKIYYIPYYGLQGMWDARKDLSEAAKSSMGDFVSTLTKCHGWGAFMAYQVAVDLSYSNKWLGKAPDINTFTSPGPGTTRGMNRLLNGARKPIVTGAALNPHMIQLRSDMNSLVKEHISYPWTKNPKTGFADLSMSNVSNCLCEYDKYCRIISDEGEPRSRYAGH